MARYASNRKVERWIGRGEELRELRRGEKSRSRYNCPTVPVRDTGEEFDGFRSTQLDNANRVGLIIRSVWFVNLARIKSV